MAVLPGPRVSPAPALGECAGTAVLTVLADNVKFSEKLCKGEQNSKAPGNGQPGAPPPLPRLFTQRH